MDLLALAIGHHQQGEFEKAEALYRKLLGTHPEQADALHLLGVVTAQRGDLAGGAQWMRQALVAKPGTVTFLQNLAGTLVNLAGEQRVRHDYTAAGRALREAITCVPSYWPAHTNLGNLLAECGHHEEAELHLREAWRLQPNAAAVAYGLGSLLTQRGQVTEAERLLRHAIAEPSLAPMAHCNLGQCLKDQGRIGEALMEFREALRLKPDWPEVEGNILYTLTYSPEHSAEEIFAAHREWGEALMRRIPAQLPVKSSPTEKRKIRIGYLSQDFRLHAVMFFFEALFERHDRSRFEIFCYACTRQRDAVTDRLEALGDNWRCLDGLDDEGAAERIRRDQLDILIDLAGHSAGSRLQVLARKPAPVQVTYLGYPHSTGLPTIDYRITDAVADPPGRAEALNTEKVVHLPRCNWCYRPPDYAPPVAPAPETRRGYVTFGCFNQWAKVNDRTIDSWIEILRRTETTHLLLKSKLVADAPFTEALRKRFSSAGIDTARLELTGVKKTLREHLQSYDDVDIALDTFPYNGTTTTAEALWMGVPVVTWMGGWHVARVSASLLKSVGLEKLVGQTPDDYIRIAIELAEDRERLANLRQNLRQRMTNSELCDRAGFTHEMEATYEKMVFRMI